MYGALVGTEEVAGQLDCESCGQDIVTQDG